MRKISVFLSLVCVLSLPAITSAGIDKLQKEDFPRFGIGMLQLYYNIGKSCVDFTRTLVVSLPNLPRGIAADIFHIGAKEEPSAYYMTEEEKEERERQKRLEKKMEKEEEKTLKEEGKEGITKIR